MINIYFYFETVTHCNKYICVNETRYIAITFSIIYHITESIIRKSHPVEYFLMFLTIQCTLHGLSLTVNFLVDFTPVVFQHLQMYDDDQMVTFRAVGTVLKPESQLFKGPLLNKYFSQKLWTVGEIVGAGTRCTHVLPMLFLILYYIINLF